MSIEAAALLEAATKLSPDLKNTTNLFSIDVLVFVLVVDTFVERQTVFGELTPSEM